jgi:hypothetical protein
VARSDANPDWPTLVAEAPRLEIAGLAWRVVESQEEVATTALVDDLAEQEVLERLLEASKPPYPDIAGQLHYLLTTPFRYPPLPWGSRFGTRLEPSLYYASLEVETAIAEAAFYRFVFWQGMEIPPPSGRLITQHGVFSAKFHCEPGMALEKPPFADYRQMLVDPQAYVPCQRLGAVLRESDILGFTYTSARCLQAGLNVALFTPEALASCKPEEMQSWLCETFANQVTFKGSSDTLTFPIDVFAVKGNFPQPA